jgi:hypothetical protein
MVVWSWRTSTRRSVTTTIESKTRQSLASCRVEDEVHHVARQQAERAVVVFRAALAVAAGRPVAVGDRRLVDGVGRSRAGVRAVLEQAALDGLLEGPLGNVGAHSGSVPSLRTARYLS